LRLLPKIEFTAIIKAVILALSRFTEKGKNKMKLLIAIDPGNNAGIAFFDLTGSIKFIESVKVKEATGGKIGAILDGFFAAHEETVEKVNIIIEDQFFFQNADTLKKIARNSGIFVGTLQIYFKDAETDVQFVTPKQWQSAMLAIGGKAKRQELIRMYHLKAEAMTKTKVSVDEAAAICIGFWYAGELKQKERR